MTTHILKKIYKKHPEAICRLIDEEPVIIPLGSDVEMADLGAFYIVKNKTAAYIWELIDGKKTVGQIIEAVLKRFEVQAGKAETDVVHFIRELDHAKVIIEGIPC